MKTPEWPEGLKKTRQRESVLAVLERAQTPLSALEIASEIEKSGEPVWLSTVYRILELFVKSGVAVKLAVMNSDMAVYERNRFAHKHYAVCMRCHKIVPMENCPMERFVPKLEDGEFHVVGHNLEIFGYCKDCMQK